MRARLVLPLVSASADVTLALTGQSVTTSAGTLTPNISYALTGAEVTTATGVLAPELSYALTGSSVAAQAGTVTTAVSYGLTGSEASAQTGSLTPSLSYALTGATVTATAGTLTADTGESVTPDANSGGWEYGDAGRWGWTREDYEAERKRLLSEVTPSKKAVAVIQRVAKQAVERAKKVDGPPLLETLLKRKDDEARQLEKALKRSRIAYDAAFAQIMLLEAQWMVLEQWRTYEIALKEAKRQDDEDEQLIALFMEM